MIKSSHIKSLVAMATFAAVVRLLMYWRGYAVPAPPVHVSQDQRKRLMKYAPIVYLDEREEYFPCDLEQFLANVVPYHNDRPLKATKDKQLTLDNLSFLNGYGKTGRDIFLTVKDDIAHYPEWLRGRSTEAEAARMPVIFVSKKVPGKDGKPEDVIDMFWFFFFNFNAGLQTADEDSFGNHVGDLEHSVVRFRNGDPESVYLSRHSSGNLYTYDAVEKEGLRPILYAGRGTHALYGRPGGHEYAMPDGSKIIDHASKGYRWDPQPSALAYSLNMTTQEVHALYPETAPTDWFKFTGQWGDQAYHSKDKRQGTVAGQKKWRNGPGFAVNKNLERQQNCEYEERHCPLETEIHVTRRSWGT